MTNLDLARDDASRSSGGGIGFLLAYTCTMIVVTVLAFVLPVNVAALVFLFQGGVALPAAFWLERRFGFPPMAQDNPLRSLAIQLAMVQVVALPAAIVTYGLNAAYVPAVFAAVAGGHFLPYVWLHRTRAYLALALATSLVPFALMVALGEGGFPYVPLAMALLYGAMAVVLRLRFGGGVAASGAAV